MNVITVYDNVIDRIGENENAHLSFAKFNRFSQLTELQVIDWLTGNADIIPAPPFQKNKDWMSVFIKKSAQQVTGGVINKPDDYYTYDNFYRIGAKVEAACDDDEAPEMCNTPIEILDGQQYYVRCRTYIEEKKPSFKKPIAKIVGNTFEVLPNDLGSVVLEYVRRPIFGEIKEIHDPVFNEDVPNPNTSINYEWPDSVRPVFVWFIADMFANYTREQALKQFNAASKP